MTSKKKGSKRLRRPHPPKSLGTGQDGSPLRWQRILIGLRGGSESEPGDVAGFLQTARAAIEETFTDAARYYWTSGDWKDAIVPGGGADVEGLATFVTQQLNEGRKPGISLEFRAQLAASKGSGDGEEPPSALRSSRAHGRSRGRRRDIANQAATTSDPLPVEKPDDVLCWYVGPTVWIDDVTFRLMLVTGSGDTATLTPWRPDGRHPMLVRFVFDCPYLESV